ncbi:MAG: hypothetical protein IID38_12205, partial [Planctomycetes bacterium]|nr:hypothetical protein [Planctomycetota bacterium]
MKKLVVTLILTAVCGTTQADVILDGIFDGDFGFNMNFSGRGNGRGYGNGYNGYNGYAPYVYGYPPYGYGIPVHPAVEMTDERKQAMADQQARYIENRQNARQQAAEFYASHPRPPMHDMRKTMMERHEAATA